MLNITIIIHTIYQHQNLLYYFNLTFILLMRYSYRQSQRSSQNSQIKIPLNIYRQSHVVPVSQPIDISFRNLTYSVETKVGRHDVVPCKGKYMDTTLLKDLSGIFKAGQITAIMGASGAGKTTLLNVIACRIQSKSLTGFISANGMDYDFETFGDFANYVTQKDILMNTLTVRQTLQLAADLKLSLTQEQKQKRINKLVKWFKLEKCIDVRVGGLLQKGISGGQKKRTSIAFELISDPSVLILDQPTSGLDSLTSFIIMSYLKHLASQQGKNIIMTIHQPSNQIYQLFDKLFLMVQGRFIYQGPISNGPPYFLQNFGLTCPSFFNPAEFFMIIMHHENKLNQKRYPYYFQTYSQQNAPFIEQQIRKERKEAVVKRKVNVTFEQSLKVLIKKDLRNSIRNPLILQFSLLTALFVPIFVCGLYYPFHGQFQTEQGLRALIGFLFFMNISTMMNALAPVQFVFPSQRDVFLKEQGSKLYSTFAYFLSRSIVQFPSLVVLPFIQCLIQYWFIGLSSTATQFFTFYFVAFLVALNGNSLGLMLGSIIQDQKSVSTVTPIVLLPFILFSGFFKNAGNLASWIGWIQYLSPIKYGFTAWVKNQFRFRSEETIAYLNLDTSLGMSIGMLIVLAMVFRFISFFFLWFLRRRQQ